LLGGAALDAAGLQLAPRSVYVLAATP
jgi:hypothetical protein